MTDKSTMKKKVNSPVGEDFDSFVIEELRRDPAFREEYIKDMVSESDPKMLIIALQRVVDVVGGVSAVAEATGLSRTGLYRTLSGEVSPDYISMTKILEFVGMHFTVERNKKPVAFTLETKLKVIPQGSFRRASRILARRQHAKA